MSKNPASAKPTTAKSSTVSPWLAGVSALCVVGLAGLIIILSTLNSSSLPQSVNGDSVGPQNGEDLSSYVTRADKSLSQAAAETNGRPEVPSASHDSRYWALVTFNHPLNDADTAAVFADLPQLRVASILIGAVVTRDLPEPSPAATRQRLISNAIEHVTVSSGLQPGDPRLRVSNAVVFGDIAALQHLRQTNNVAAVEPLPLGAQRGRFGVRPYFGPELQIDLQPPALNGDQPGSVNDSNVRMGEG